MLKGLFFYWMVLVFVCDMFFLYKNSVFLKCPITTAGTRTVDLEDSEFVLIDAQIPKTACLACLKGLLNILLRNVKGSADFGKILVFICETQKSDKSRRICLRCYGNRQLYSLLPSTRLVIVFPTGNLVFVRITLKPAVFEEFCV